MKIIPLIHNYDERRDIAIPGDAEKTLDFCVSHFVECAKNAITERGRFFVALSGGSTPQALYRRLLSDDRSAAINWGAVWVFWSDERCVLPDHPESNYRMAMEAGFSQLPIPEKQIFPMKGEGNAAENAAQYAALIKKHVPHTQFDLILLGMGKDGHTASLFPRTAALHAHKEQIVVSNYVPQQDAWRLTFTFSLINRALETVIYVVGREKAGAVKQVFNTPFDFEAFPVQAVGTVERKALWILDEDAARK